MMESLGFTETPSVAYSSPRPASPKLTPARLVSTNGSRGSTVDEMWNTTELQAGSMTDWKPVDMERRLNKRVRYPLIVIWVVIVGVLTSGGVWLWQNSDRTSSAAFAAVQDAAAELAATLDPLVAAAASIDPTAQAIPDTVLPPATDTDEASRTLFSTAAELSTSYATSRALATDAATQTLNATRNLTNTAAYLAAITPMLTTPSLITEPDLIDMGAAATDFGGWRARFDMVVSNLPEDVLSPVTAELAGIGSELEAIQGAYLDGLREDDQTAALEAVRTLEGRLASAWSLILDEVELAKTSIQGDINTAKETLVSLTG
jgi:hypothetical protein